MKQKERAAMQQALEDLELFGIDDMAYIKSEKAITALRKALAERHKENCACEVCRGCDNADMKAEQAEQEPVGWIDLTKEELHQIEMTCETSAECYRVIAKALKDRNYAATIQQAEQEPVAWAYEYGTDRGDAVNEIRWYPNLTALHKPKPEEGKLIRNVRPLYAAPVRTKDLTDDEISRLWYDSSYGDSGIDFARAVIAAYREKNK